MNNSNRRTFDVSYMREANKDVEKMIQCNAFGFMMAIQRICKERNLDPYNMDHIIVAVELLKMQVCWN
jgi:hypothetical protein